MLLVLNETNFMSGTLEYQVYWLVADGLTKICGEDKLKVSVNIGQGSLEPKFTSSRS